MEIRILKYFLTVAREENITRAANLLHITQPTLSRQLMQLEDELGVKLFRRSSHHITLTDDGLLLKRRAQEIVSLAEKTKRDFSMGKQLDGEIEIGSGEFKSFSLFSDIMADFKEKNPAVSFRLNSGNADNIKDCLEKGLADIGIVSEPVDISKYDFVRMPQKEIWGVLMRSDNALASKTFITPDDLSGINILIPQRLTVQNELQNWFGDIYGQAEITAVYDLIYNAAVMVRKDMGIVLTIDLDNRFDDLKFIPLSPALQFTSVVVWKKNQIHTNAVDAFITHIKQYLKGISEHSL